MKNRTIFIISSVVIAAAIVGLFIASMVLATQPGNRPDTGAVSLDFNISLYQSYRAGLPENVKLSDLRGKVVLLNFWASWCVECRKESDALEKVWRQYKDRGLVILGVDYLDTEPAAIQYLQEYDTTYIVGADIQQRISHAYRITGVPESFFIDRKGVIRKTVLQAMTHQELVTTIEGLLNE